MIYLLCFGVSILFATQANRARNRQTFLFFSVLSIAVTVALAGLRDYSIGIDTKNYLRIYWQPAVSFSSIGEYFKYYFVRGYSEPLFALLVSVIAQLFGEYRVFLFAVHTIIIGCVYVGAFRMKAHANPVFTLLVFYLLYYSQSLNISRQYMAMAIIFAAAADIEKGKYLRYLFFVVIAALLHNTGIFGVMPMVIYRVIYTQREQKNVSLARRFVICTLLVGGVYLFVPMAQLLIRNGLLSRRYLFYMNEEGTSNYLLTLLFLLVEAVGLVLFWKSFKKNNLHADFYIFCSLAFFLLTVMASSLQYGKRIASYFSILNIISLGMLVECQKKKRNREILGAVIILVVFIYWLYVFVYRNASQTMPYILGV